MSISTQLIHTLDTFPGKRRELRELTLAGMPRPPEIPRGTLRRYGAGSTLFREGAASSEVFVLVSGIVKLVRHLPNGRARIVGLHGPGAVLGMLADRPGWPINPHSAMTLGPAEAECWSRRGLHRLRREQPESYIELLERVHDQAGQADLWITEFSTGRIKSRVARLILFLERIEAGVGEGEVELLTCQEMGEILGITPESVSRVVASMKREGLLKALTDGASDRLRCDLAALQRIAGD